MTRTRHIVGGPPRLYDRGMTEWHIRSAVAADIDAVLSFWAASDAFQSSTDNPVALARLIEDFDGLLLAERGSALVGTLIATWDGWRGNMYRLVVDQSLRRQGIALALVAAGERRLTELGCRRLCALVMDAHEHAVSFWAAAGYRADPAMTRHVKMI
jgi:GNAT superfamily N-acetyltransferase